MAIYRHQTHFDGKPVVQWSSELTEHDFANTVYRISLDWDDQVRWTDLFGDFLSKPGVNATTGFIVGAWWGADLAADPVRVVEALVAAAPRLPELRALFMGEITSEENEISWINQTDLSPLFHAYPQLQTLMVRGGNNLSLGRPRHEHLKTLIIQAGGLTGAVVQDVAASQLPALEHLELWLGTANYGATVTMADVQPILDGQPFPALQYLGLRNSDLTDDIASVIANAPIVKRLKVLDLSMGTLSNAGGEALLQAAPHLSHLERLDLDHHYCSDEITAKLKALGGHIHIGEKVRTYEDEDDYRYVAVGE